MSRARAKIGPLEGEIHRETAVLAVTDDPAVPLTAPEAPREPTDIDSDAVGDAGVSENEDWFSLVTSGRYEEGLERVRRFAAEESPAVQAAYLGLARNLAFQSGTTRALEDLRRSVEADPQFVQARLRYARTLQSARRYDEALSQAQSAKADAQSDTEKADAARTLSDFLRQAKKYDEAAAVALEALRLVRDSKAKHSLLQALAAAFEASGDLRRAFPFYEAALREDPNDTKLRFDLGFKYGQAEAFSMALHHYRQLLVNEPTNNAALNNAGWAAQNLKLPINAANYYLQAADAGSTLAMSNLASLFLSVGFVELAQEELERAQATGDPDSRVMTVLSEVVQRQDEETKSSASLAGRAEDLIKWRLVEADLLIMGSNTPSHAPGTYRGMPASAVLIVESSGAVSGSFEHGLARRAQLIV